MRVLMHPASGRGVVVTIYVTSRPGAAASPASSLRPGIGRGFGRIWHGTFLARRANGSSSDLAVRLLPG
jgi:hypothetical protein